MIKAWVMMDKFSLPVMRVLEDRGWELELVKDINALRARVETVSTATRPDVVLLGSRPGDLDNRDAIFCLGNKPIEGRWLVAPFMADYVGREFVRARAGMWPQRIKITDALGGDPQSEVLHETERLVKLEAGIRVIRGGVEGGVADAARRK